MSGLETKQTVVKPLEEHVVELELQVAKLRKFEEIVPALQTVIMNKNSEIVELSFENKRLNETIAVHKERIEEMTAALATVTDESKEDLVFTAQSSQLGKSIFANSKVYMHFSSLTRQLDYLVTDTEAKAK